MMDNNQKIEALQQAVAQALDEARKNQLGIYIVDGVLTFYGDQLATRDEYALADRCVGSVFDALEPGEVIELAEGLFQLDEDLDVAREW